MRINSIFISEEYQRLPYIFTYKSVDFMGVKTTIHVCTYTIRVHTHVLYTYTQKTRTPIVYSHKIYVIIKLIFYLKSLQKRFFCLKFHTHHSIIQHSKLIIPHTPPSTRPHLPRIRTHTHTHKHHSIIQHTH